MSQTQLVVQDNTSAAMHEMALRGTDLKRQVALVHEAMSAVMKNGEHYGIIKGCGNKPSLLKPGAEVLAFAFQLAASYQITKESLPNGHREYEVTCVLRHRPTGNFVGEGIGSCSTLEGKYRFRTGAGELTDIPVPKAYWENRDTNSVLAAKILKEAANAAGIEGDKFRTKKNDDSKWVITTFADKVEHDNPADYYNTCLKMAKKRAFVDAILTCTAASDCFTQDIEDDPDLYGGSPRAQQATSPARLDMEAVRASMTGCMTLEALDRAVAALGIDKTHPDASAVGAIYHEIKSFIENASEREGF